MKKQTKGTRVVFFGTFDPIHDGHRHAFAEAKLHGDYLVVVVARDATIAAQKQREPRVVEQQLLAEVISDPSVDEAVLGDADATSYATLEGLAFDVLAVGYDQKPSDAEIGALLAQHGHGDAKVVRLAPYKPAVYKSSIVASS